MTELLPCPFCGDRLVQRHAGWFDHPKGKCILSGRAFHKGWIGQWNKRADLPRPQDAARIAELEAGRQSAHAVMSRAFEVIEICHRVLHFNLNRMIADDSDDYNQAVRDAADATYRFMQEISAAHAIALAADSGADHD